MKDITKLEEWFLTIDWELLKEQKINLIKTLNNYGHLLPVEQTESVEGILNLLDNLQDTVVEAGYKIKQEVFNLTEE